MNDQKKTVNLSFLLTKSEEEFSLRYKATIWFNAILSLLQKYEGVDLQDDLTTSQKVSLVKIMGHAVAAVTDFYQQQQPRDIFKLFSFVEQVLEMAGQCKDYSFVICKVNYLNVIAMYFIKIRQYSYALQVYQQILDIYSQRIIDNTHQIFLTALSNYLSLLRKCSRNAYPRIKYAQGLFKELFFDYLLKLRTLRRQTDFEAFQNKVHLLTGVYCQHQALLGQYGKGLREILNAFYQNPNKRLPEDLIEFVFGEKIKRGFSLKIGYNRDELLFYSAIQFKNAVQIASPSEESEAMMKKMEEMLQRTIEMSREQKIILTRVSQASQYSIAGNQSNLPTLVLPSAPRRIMRQSNLAAFHNIGTMPTISNSIEEPSISKQTLETINNPVRKPQRVQPLPRSLTKQGTVSQRGRGGLMKKITKFKILSMFLEINEDGILLSDYTKENNRYIEWNTISLLIERLEAQFVFEDYLKTQIHTFYDVVRILGCYLTKNEARELCLKRQPTPLLEVNSLFRLYKQEGKYLKLALMNQYNTQRFVGVIDCYMSQHSEYFKSLSENEYILYLNDRVTSRVNDNPFEREAFFRIDFIKRKRKTTSEELGKLLEVEIMGAVIEERGALYKCLFLLKNNTQLLLRVMEPGQSQVSQDESIRIQIETLQRFSNEGLYSISSSNSMKQSPRIRKVVQISLSTLTHYFPLFDKSLREYLLLYAKMVADCLNTFQDLLAQVNLGGLKFEFISHASKTETINYGKYYSVVSAELVGSRERVWALVIRFFDMAYLGYKVTVLMNPYSSFLENAIKGSKEEKSQILSNLLLEESVKETYLWLRQKGKVQGRGNLLEYLEASRLI